MKSPDRNNIHGQIPAARQRIIDRIAAQAARKRQRVGKVPVAAFIGAYYRGVAEEDLSARGIPDLVGAARAHLEFGRMRKQGTPLVRVYSPVAKRDPFASSHTIVEVVCDDMPFLVDSLAIVFAQQTLDVHLTIHPVLRVQRDRAGALVSIEPDSGGTSESWQHIEIDRLPDDETCDRLRQKLVTVLGDVHRACGDWPKMRDQAKALAQELRAIPRKQVAANTKESAALLDWLADNHFTFLGYREFRLVRGPDIDLLEPMPDTSLGILRTRTKHHTVELTGELRTQARAPEPVFITKANTLSTVHRGTYLDYVGVKRFDGKGTVIGERRFLGLFTSTVYQAGPRDIPLLREKIEQLIERFGIAANSHDGKAVAHVIDTYPRDELFQATVEDLMASVRGIVNLYERQQVRLFVRKDRFNRYYSCLLFVPRDRYNTQVRKRIEAIVLEALHGTAVELQVQLGDSALARVHMLVRVRTEDRAKVNTPDLERHIAEAVRTWSDHLRDALIAKHGEPTGLQLARQFANAFPAGYQADASIEDTLRDIEQLGPLLASGDGIELRLNARGEAWHLRTLRSGAPVVLSDALPVLENMGLRVLTERPYRVTTGNERAVWIQDFELQPAAKAASGVDVEHNFRDAYLAIDSGHAENDGFNRLVFAAGLEWRSVSVLRAYARYLLQTGLPFSQNYMEQTLSRNAGIAVNLWHLFAQQFDPVIARARDAQCKSLRDKILKQLDQVASPDEDRILRTYLNTIDASLRTNFYQRENGKPKPYLSIKLDSRRLELPLPKPLVEIFVYSPRVEGVHLRMGRVARGGLRWSDRREDFRTEILGLMKAQNVKNTVIVPVGAKGGFVPKQMPAGATADDRQREGVACYRTFIRALLDLTDNLVGGRLVPPPNVVRRDDDDPYLVVAADKGTATFSDIANGISAEYKFWLGDAFASGGSAGYDHKKMAITARGAWECVKRHFRELGVDTQSQDFTVIGIGDMAGDVFGNGMLRCKHIRLQAAFNHQHIFLDPEPNAATSFAERERLFNLPRSTWKDYNTDLISKGGGIVERSAKSITLSPQVQRMLEVSDTRLSPQALMKAILKMRVDLFWNGGIGTYVKSSDESHAQVGDRANDSVRVDGRELRCKVIGEGGNLGLTQYGRIEYALSGGKLNTDFIDNSAGVDCSDHEVNIKILLNAATEKGLKSAERNKLLVQMTDDVGSLVLRDNYLQSQALSMIEQSAKDRLAEHGYFIRSLEITNELDRSVEYLPSAEELTERGKQGGGLTRPELAVLLSYSKIALFNRLIGTDVPEDPYLSQELERYFPKILPQRYRTLMRKHRLRREIITTAITNSLVNRMGPSFALRTQEDTGADAATIARAYAIAREIFEVRELWLQIEALDNKVPATTQYALMNEIARLLRFVTYWLINRNRPNTKSGLHIEQQVAALRPGIRELRKELKSLLRGDAAKNYAEQYAKVLGQHIPAALATHLAGVEALYGAPDIVEIAAESKANVLTVASVYFKLDELLSLSWLRDQVLSLSVQDRWQAVARTTLRDNVYELHRALCLQVLERSKRAKSDEVISAWQTAGGSAVQHAIDSLKEMRTLPRADFATLSVATQAIRKLT
jgi:glutamate dehydrogenase